MSRRPLGRTGIEVSAVILGCGSIGGIGSPEATLGKGLTEEEGLAQIDAAVALGVCVIDTANSYAGGFSEQVVGRWLREHPDAEVLVETKVGNLVEPGQTSVDLTSEHIARQSRVSRDRLGRIDLYLSHAPDDSTPIEETLEAFAALKEVGVIRDFGACNVSATQLARALEAADRMGIPGYGWVQNEYNLLAREDEADVIPLVVERGLGYTPFSPLAGGLLAGTYRLGEPPPSGSRMDVAGSTMRNLDESTEAAIGRLTEHARGRGVSTAGLALAWVLGAAGVTAPVVAPRTAAHFESVTEALGLDLDEDEWRRVGGFFSPGAG